MKDLIIKFLFSKERIVWWLLFALILGLYSVNIKLAVALNEWNGRFFNALQNVDKNAIYHEIFNFIWLAGVIIILLVAADYLKRRLILWLRKDLTFVFIDTWLNDSSSHYRMQLAGCEPDNPDQRISDDVNILTSLGVDLSVSLFDALLTICSFSVILWSLSGPITFGSITIPGYMFFVCILYTFVATVITHFIGYKLKPLNIETQKREADFRASLIDKKRNTDSIAGMRAEKIERERLKNRFMALYRVSICLIKKQRDLDLFTVGLGQVTFLAPIFFALPAFLSGQIVLGGLMQLRGAFTDVARALSWLIFAYSDVARLNATYYRLKKLKECADRVNKNENSNHWILNKENGEIKTSLTLDVPRKKTQQIDFVNSSGETTVITGTSGIGKSTLLKTLSGFYTSYTGSVQLPEVPLYSPQTQYIPPGTLKEVLTYPDKADSVSDESASAVLKSFDLEEFTDSLYVDKDWNQSLSGGEKQRVILARIALNKSDCLLLDEPTSALDEEQAFECMFNLRKLKKNSSVVIVTHQTLLFNLGKVIRLTGD